MINMLQTTITSKGQVTIPKHVRDSLCLHAGDKVEFIITENNEVLIRPFTKKANDIFGKLNKVGRKRVSIEQMDEAIRQKLRESFE